MNYKIRKATKDDENIIKELFYYSIYVPENAPPVSMSIVDLPELQKYYKDWGNTDDIAYLIENNSEIIAGIWLRLFDITNKGYGFVDDETPELAIAVKNKYRSNGLGTKLMSLLLNDPKVLEYNSISLSVDKSNRAVNLYLKYNFKIFAESNETYIMLKNEHVT
jgi:ribosomal protein S18 acetylase RimI-like enzyme